MKQLLSTLRYSLRLSLKAPANTLLCMLVLSGSIALTASMFRLCHVAFLWNFPYENAERVMVLESVNERGERSNWWKFDTADSLVNEDKGEVFSQILQVYKYGMTAHLDDAPTGLNCAYISWDFARTFGVKPFLGRGFVETDAQADGTPVILVGEKFWRAKMDASADVVGQTIRVGKTTRTIIGVMPSSFDFPTSLSYGGCEAWVPYTRQVVRDEASWTGEINLYGVVKEGVSIRAAEKRFSDSVLRTAEILPEENKGIIRGAFTSLNDSFMQESIKTLIRITAFAALLVLLMGCGIVSSLLTARYSPRMQELAVRSALGASRGRIVAQMLVEFSLISASSVVLGLLLDAWLEGVVFAKYYNVLHLPVYAQGVSTFWFVLFVAGVMSLVTILSAIMPALRASRADVSGVMRESTRTGSSLRVTRLSNFLIASQVAITCVILVGGLMVGMKIHELHHEEAYYDPFDYLCAIISIDENASEEERADLCMRLLRDLQSQPEIEAAGVSTEVFNNASMQWGCEDRVWIDGQVYESEDRIPRAMYRVVSPGYFHSLNVPILAGRDFTYEDDRKHPFVAAVTTEFALKHFGTLDVLGKGIRIWWDKGPLYTIVAVVPDLYNSKQSPGRLSGFFVPYQANPWNEIPVYIKGRAAPELYGKLLTDAVHRMHSSSAVVKMMNMGAMKDYHGWGFLLQLVFTFFMAFGISALILAASGLYGVISFSVNMRRVEMGIRLALGANPAGLAVHIARRGMLYVGVGLAAGVVLTVLMRVFFSGMMNQFYLGWEIYPMAFLSMLLISFAAVMIPASRGVVIEPADALREE
jgi:predicted permease